MTTESAATESQQPQRAPAGTSQAPKTTVDALVALFSSFAASWVRPLENPLPERRRRFFAFAGSLPWLIVNVDPTWLKKLEVFDESGIGGLLLEAVAFLFQVSAALWFAFLIGYQDRRCSPARFFLEGLIFPGIAATLLSGSVLTTAFGIGG